MQIHDDTDTGIVINLAEDMMPSVEVIKDGENIDIQIRLWDETGGMCCVDIYFDTAEELWWALGEKLDMFPEEPVIEASTAKPETAAR